MQHVEVPEANEQPRVGLRIVDALVERAADERPGAAGIPLRLLRIGELDQVLDNPRVARGGSEQEVLSACLQVALSAGAQVGHRTVKTGRDERRRRCTQAMRRQRCCERQALAGGDQATLEQRVDRSDRTCAIEPGQPCCLVDADRSIGEGQR